MLLTQNLLAMCSKDHSQWIWRPHVYNNPALGLADFEGAYFLEVMKAGACPDRDALWRVALIQFVVDIDGNSLQPNLQLDSG